MLRMCKERTKFSSWSIHTVNTSITFAGHSWWHAHIWRCYVCLCPKLSRKWTWVTGRCLWFPFPSLQWYDNKVFHSLFIKCSDISSSSKGLSETENNRAEMHIPSLVLPEQTIQLLSDLRSSCLLRKNHCNYMDYQFWIMGDNELRWNSK